MKLQDALVRFVCGHLSVPCSVDSFVYSGMSLNDWQIPIKTMIDEPGKATGMRGVPQFIVNVPAPATPN